MPIDASRLKHLLPLMLVQVVGIACGLIGVRLSSTLIPPAVLGLYGLLLSSQRLGAFVTHQGLVKHVERYWTADTPGRAYGKRLARAALAPTVWLAGGSVIVLLVLNVSGNGAFAARWWLWIVVVNVLTVAAHLTHAALQAEQRYWSHLLLSAAGSVTRTFLPIALILVAGASLDVLGWGFVGHTVVWAAVGFWCLRSAWRRPARRQIEEIKSPGKMVRTLLWAGVFGWVAAAATPWFAAAALDAQTTGYFILAFNLTAVIPASVSAIALSYTFPPLFESARRGAPKEQLLRATNLTTVITLGVGQVGLLVLAWLGPRLVGPLVNPRYAESMDWILAAGGGGLAAIANVFYGNLLIARGLDRACTQLAASSAVLRIGILALLLASGSTRVFALGLCFLPWPTVIQGWWLTRRWIGDDDATRNTTPDT